MDQLDAAMQRVREGRLAALTSDPPIPPTAESDPVEPVTPATSDPIEPVETAPVEPIESAEPTESIAPTEPTEPTIEINGQSYQLSEVQSLIEFDNALRSNPALFYRIQEAVRSPLDQPYNPNVRQQVQEPVTEPPTPPAFSLPPDLDLDDPATKFMADQFTNLQSQYQSLAEQNSRFSEYLNQQQSQLTNNSIELGITNFRKDNPDITDTEFLQLREEIQRTQLLSGLAQTGMDIASATKEAFERSMWATPGIRDRILHAKEIVSLEEQREERTRQAKLTSLSGSSSTTPRVPTPTTPVDRKTAMINELAEALGQRSQSS